MLHRMQQALEMDKLVASVLASYRASLLERFAKGTSRPLVLPYCLFGTFILPALWLSIPQDRKRRPWLYETRWIVVIIVLALNCDQVLHASSTNVASSYAAGMTATWGSMLCLNLMVWTRPQENAARAVKVNGSFESISQSDSKAVFSDALQTKGLRNRGARRNGHPAKVDGEEQNKSEFHYVWQRFPAQSPFIDRFGWALDLICSFRGSGWNWSSSAIPRPANTEQSEKNAQIDVARIPARTPSGYCIPRSQSSFFTGRLTNILISYALLDLMSALMMKDIYFILGPDHLSPPKAPQSSHLMPHPKPYLVFLYRQLLSFIGVLSAISAVFSAAEIVQYFLIKRFFPSRHALWFYASTFGSFSQVLDRGLAGFWGSWWHQTFRVQFLAPATYLLQRGYIKKGTRTGTFIAMLITFAQSGLMHGSGSISAIGPCKPWKPLLFFLLQAAGILAQTWLSKALPPVSVRVVPRMANLLFTLTWLFATAPLFVDDLASFGLWMLEPVPVSFVKPLGLGYPGDKWWRWDEHFLPRWHTGHRWWESGIAI